MTNDLSWESLLLIEPRLEKVLKAAKELRSVRNRRPHFCANSYWLVSLPGRLSYKQVCERLTKNIPGAYKIVAEKVYYALPDCRDCFCKTIRIIPKSKKLIQITKLFNELKKGSDWYNSHPNDREGFNSLYAEAQPIFDQLESLGVSRTFSESVLIFGPEITPDLVIQFEEGK